MERKFIKLHTAFNDPPREIFIAADAITVIGQIRPAGGHEAYTQVVTDGGPLSVHETPDEIMRLIKEA